MNSRVADIFGMNKETNGGHQGCHMFLDDDVDLLNTEWLQKAFTVSVSTATIDGGIKQYGLFSKKHWSQGEKGAFYQGNVTF